MARNKDGIDNILTRATLGTADAIAQAQERLQSVIGNTPFMQKDLTKYGKRQQYESFTPQDWQNMIRQFGPDAVLNTIRRREAQRRD